MSTALIEREQGLPARVLQQERELTSLADAETCQQVAEMLVGSYPNANPGDPATYMRAMRALLGGYPATVVAAIANPRTGIVTKCKFPPTMAEIEEFAAPYLARMQASLKRDRETVLQIEQRDEPVSDEERQQRVSQLKALADSMRSKKDEYTELMRERFRRTQCAPGDAIRASLGIEKPEFSEQAFTEGLEDDGAEA